MIFESEIERELGQSRIWSPRLIRNLEKDLENKSPKNVKMVKKIQLTLEEHLSKEKMLKL